MLTLLECLLANRHWCQNNPEKSYTEKNTKCAPSGYWLFANCSFDSAENKLDCYKGENAWKRAWKRACNENNWVWKKMKPLTDEENKSHKEQKVCYICKKEFSDDDDDNDDNNNKDYQRVGDRCHYTGLENLEKLLMVFVV